MGLEFWFSVTAGLDPVIYENTAASLEASELTEVRAGSAAWMAGTRPAMTALPIFNPGPTAKALRA